MENLFFFWILEYHKILSQDLINIFHWLNICKVHRQINLGQNRMSLNRTHSSANAQHVFSPHETIFKFTRSRFLFGSELWACCHFKLIILRITQLTALFSPHREYRPMEQVNFLDNDTKVAAVNIKTYIFQPNMSRGPESELIRTVNIPVMVGCRNQCLTR